MKIIAILKQAINARFKFCLLIIFHIIFYSLICFYVGYFRTIIIFSGIWTIGYLFAIRRFLANPIDDFAAKHISYAPPNMYWVNLAKGVVKNNARFIFVSSIHLFMSIIPIFVYKNFIDQTLFMVSSFISNALLPVTYLYVLKKLYFLWMQESK